MKSIKTIWKDEDFKTRAKTVLLGNNEKRGLVPQIICYSLLILFGFVYLYPILYMLAYSLMSPSDVVSPTVNYWPTEFYWQNFVEAAQTMDFWSSLLSTILVSVLPSVFQTVSTCLVAYGLARFDFPGKKIILGLIIFTFIVPTQITMIPQLVLYKDLGLLNSILAYLVPASLGQGIKSAVFILIFYQFFRAIPKSIEEAAKIDGANSLQIFWKVGIPSAIPAILLSFLFSVVWYYNETVLSAIYLGGELTTLPLQLQKFQASYESMFGTIATSGKSVNEAIYMAGTLLNILPLIIMYIFTQRFFVDGIDKAGITGE